MKGLVEYLNESKSVNKSNYKDFLKNRGMEKNLKEWYKKNYKTDELGDDIVDITFAEALALFFTDTKKFVEDCCAGGDSIVRERVFEKLSELCKCDYDDFYRYWLNTDW